MQAEYDTIPADLERKDGTDASVVEQITREIRAMGDNHKALADSAKRDLHEVRGLVEATKGEVSSEMKRQVDALSESVLSKLDAAKKEAEKRADDIEARMNRAALGGGGAGGKDAAAERKAAMDFHRMKLAATGQLKAGVPLRDADVDYEGVKAWNDEFGFYLRAKDDRAISQKALSVGSDPDGGYFVPVARSARILQRIYETSPVRQVATVETISTADIEIPRDEGEAGAGWVGETTSPAETATPQLGMAKIVVHEMYAEPRVTQKMLEDASIDIEAWLGMKVADRFSRLEATSFVTGDGSNKPRGFLTYANGTANGQIERVASGATGAITADALISLQYALKEFYAANGAFMMRRSTLRSVMLLKDTTGQYLFRPNLTAGAPATVLGSDVYQAADMPAVATGALAVAFADWRSFYTIVDRLGITVLRDPLTAKPFIKFYSRRRVGGDVVNFEAGKLLEIG